MGLFSAACGDPSKPQNRLIKITAKDHCDAYVQVRSFVLDLHYSRSRNPLDIARANLAAMRALINQFNIEKEKRAEIEELGELLNQPGCGTFFTAFEGLTNKPMADEVLRLMISGAVSSLDPHSAYIYGERQLRRSNYYRNQVAASHGMRLYLSQVQKYAAVLRRLQLGSVINGIDVSDKELFPKYPLIDFVEPGSPADKAGLLSGDRIIEIAQQEFKGFQALAFFQSSAGLTKGEFEVKVRRGRDREFSVTIRPENFSSAPITVSTDDSKIVYLRIHRFSEGLSEAVEAVLKKLHDEFKGSSDFGIIIDLRHNPGGLINEAVATTSLLLRSITKLKKGLVCYEGREEPTKLSRKYGVANKCLGTTRKPLLPDEVPMIVLVSEESYSAAELMAQNLGETDRAIIVGRPSFGKGTGLGDYEIEIGGQDFEETLKGRLSLTLFVARTVRATTTHLRGVDLDVDLSDPRIPALRKAIRQNETGRNLIYYEYEYPESYRITPSDFDLHEKTPLDATEQAWYDDVRLRQNACQMHKSDCILQWSYERLREQLSQ